MLVALLEDNPDAAAALKQALQPLQLRMLHVRHEPPSATERREALRKIGQARIILCDRDAGADGNFHRLVPPDAWDRVISISSLPKWNQQARRNGAPQVIAKDPADLKTWSARVVDAVAGWRQKDPEWRTPEIERASRIVSDSLNLLLQRVPELGSHFFWTGTAAIAIEETSHWASYDIDLASRRKYADIRPLVQKLMRMKDIRVPQQPDEGFFHGEMRHPSGEMVHLDIQSSCIENYRIELQAASFKGMSRITLPTYLRSKVMCLEERIEPKDWIHLGLLTQQRPPLMGDVLRFMSSMTDPYLLLPRIRNLREDKDFFKTYDLLDYERTAVDKFVRIVEEAARSKERMQGGAMEELA